MVESQEMINGYQVLPLTRDFANQHAEELARLAGQIPQVEYSAADITAESKDEGKRVFYGKWDHSFVLMDKDRPIGLVIGYERKGEGNDQYPQNTIYVSELAVHEDYQRQGIARKLLDIFFSHNIQTGMLHLPGEVNFSIQTNSAEWNGHVRKLYESFGFVQRATKAYDNRTDVVMGWTPSPAHA